MVSAVRAARSTATAGGSSTLAIGTCARTPETATMAPSTSQPSSANGAPMAAGTPIPMISPAIRATDPTSIAGATMGAISRFASGDTSDSRPKWNRIRGSVAACAASDTPRDSADQPRNLPGEGPDRRRVEVRSPPEQACRRGDRELEADVRDHRWIKQEQHPYGQAQRGQCAAGSARLAGDESDATHECRPDHARTGPRQQREASECEDDGHRTRAS